MSENRGLSRLPDDPDYWERLEARVLETATPRLRAAAGSGRNAWTPLAERAGALTGLAVAATIVAMLLVPARPNATSPAVPALLRIPHDDPTLAAFLTSPAPPSVVALVLPDAGRPR